MKKRLCMLLIAALLLMLVPHVASANAPIPWYIEISCVNVDAGTQIEVVFQREDGTTRTQIANGTTGTIGMDYESDETSFYLVCTAPDGTETRTASVQLVSWGCYRYDGATNSLSANGTYYPRGSNCADGVLTAVLIVLFLRSKRGGKSSAKGSVNLDDYDFGDDDETEDENYVNFEKYDPDAEVGDR